MFKQACEGNDADIRRFIDENDLVRLWAELVLPSCVRRAWAKWLRRHRGPDVAC